MNRSTKKHSGSGRLLNTQCDIMKKWLPVILKCIVAIVATYMALRHVKNNELQHIRWNISVIWLLPAILLFNASQFVSAYRLLQYYKTLNADIPYGFNLQLYYTGMFYNLFLPGGVGGDVYKVIILKKRGIAWVNAAKATVLDRFTGLLILLVIGLLLLNLASLPLSEQLIHILSFAIIAALLLYGFIVQRYFPPFGSVITKALALSAVVQCLQLFTFYCLLQFLQVPAVAYIQYAVIFLAAAVVAALPISIGGIGIRELSMATGAMYLHVSSTIAISASIIFYLITAFSATIGWWLKKTHPLLF